MVVAAGQGTRFGRPKQYETLAGSRVVDWSLRAARATCDGVVLVVAPEMVGGETGADKVVGGGLTRSASVRCGLAAVPADAEIIVVHDAARPMAGAALFESVLAAVRAGADGAVCAVPVADTVKQVRDTLVVRTLDRTDLWAVQTPQAFRAAVLRSAHHESPEATDDAALVEAAGGTVVVVEGDARNRKITDASDLVVAEALVATLR